LAAFDSWRLWDILPKALHASRGEEVISDPAADKAIMFEEFFAAGLWMLPHPALTDILVKFHVQLHQLTPNAFTQFSKYF
jgi:hypothetical protein